MGTRGCYGFYKNGEDKLTYNHYDSYPNYLGVDVVEFIRETSIEEMNEIFDKIVMIDGSSIPTKEQIEECSKFYNGSVGEGTRKDWYCLLRSSQGDLKVYKESLKYMIDDKKFMGDSLFCEWAYVINLDDKLFEIYRGFQKSLVENRYKKYVLLPVDNYYNVKLLKTYPLDDISEDWINEVEKMDKED